MSEDNWWETGWTDIGHGVEIKFSIWGGHDPVGLIEKHPKPDGTKHLGSIKFDLPGVREAFGGPLWTLDNLDPLTVSPSLLCQDCGHHGFIRDGRWVPA